MKAGVEQRALELNEPYTEAYENARLYKERTKIIYDRKITTGEFEMGQKVLLCNSRLRLFPSKLRPRLHGPYISTNIYPYGTLEPSDGSNGRFKVNAQRFKHYLGEVSERVDITVALTHP